MVSADKSASQARSIEARIARALSTVATWPSSDGHQGTPPAYIRRHLCDHAGAGGCLNEEIVQPRLLPFVDVNRFREAAAEAAQDRPAGSADGPGHAAVWPAVLDLARQVSHVWDWDSPGQNAAALQFWGAASRLRLAGLDALSGWRVRWAKSSGPGDIVGRLNGAITCAAADTLPGGSPIAVTGCRDGTLSVWNLTSGAVAQTAPDGSAITTMALAGHPATDVTIVTGSADGALRKWSASADAFQAPTLIAEHRGGSGVTALAATSIGSRSLVFLGRQDGSLRIWDHAEDRLVPWLARHDDPVTGIATAVRPDGGLAIVTGRLDGTLQVWQLAADHAVPTALTRPWLGHDQAIRAVAALRLADQRLAAVTAGDDGRLRVWDLALGTPIGEPLMAHGGTAVIAVAAWASADQAFAMTAGRDQTLRAWQIPGCTPAGDPLDGTDLTAVATVVLPGDRAIVITGNKDHTVRIWDWTPAMRAPRRPVDLSSRPGQSGTPGAASGWLRAWDLADGQQLGDSPRPDLSGVTAAALGTGPDGRPVVVTAVGSRRAPVALAVPDHGTLAITGHEDGFLRCWDGGQQAEIGSPVPGHAGQVTCLAAASAGPGAPVLVSGGADATVRVWDLAGLAGSPSSWTRLTGQPLLRATGAPAHDEAVTCLAAVTWNGRYLLVSASNTTVQVWDLNLRAAMGPALEFVTHSITALAAADVRGHLLCAVGTELNGDVQIWDLEQDRQIWTAEGHRRPVTAVSIAAAPGLPSVIFSASADHTLRAWDAEDQRAIGSPLPLPGVARALLPLRPDPSGPGVLLAGPGVLAACTLLASRPAGRGA